MDFFQIVLLLLIPIISLKLAKIKKWPNFLSPVILCYSTGIIIANLGILPLHNAIAELAQQVSILLAIPFLLFATDLFAWFRFAKTTLLSFSLIIFSGLFSTIVLAFIWGTHLDHTSKISGMLIGLYTGGIPNLNAIGKAIEAPSELFIYLNAADIVTGGLYLIFLTSFAPFVYGKILKVNNKKSTGNYLEENFKIVKEKYTYSFFFKSFSLAIFIIGISALLTYLFTGALKSISVILLLLTSFSILASLNSKVRDWKGTFEIGEFFILVFCIAIGLTANFELIQKEGLNIILYTGSVLLTTIALHLILCKIFKIDRDTMMITSVAALYGPPFIGQIASVIGNRSLLISGMATGLVGYAIGNYLGIFVSSILMNWFGI